MKSYRLEWTKEGRDERQVSAVMYGESAAETPQAVSASSLSLRAVEQTGQVLGAEVG